MSTLPQDVVDALMECEEGETARKPAFWTVAVYLQNKAQGGPEEGGWWYNTGERIDDPEEYRSFDAPAIFFNESDAFKHARAVNSELAEGVNAEGNRDLGSVNCEGRYAAEVYEGYPPKFYPEQRPHYE